MRFASWINSILSFKASISTSTIYNDSNDFNSSWKKYIYFNSLYFLLIIYKFIQFLKLFTFFSFILRKFLISALSIVLSKLEYIESAFFRASFVIFGLRLNAEIIVFKSSRIDSKFSGYILTPLRKTHLRHPRMDHSEQFIP